MIPFRRADAVLPAEIRSETATEAEMRLRITRNTMAASGWYRKFARGRR